MAVYLARKPSTMKIASLDDEKIDVAMRTHVPLGRRSKQDNSIRLSNRKQFAPRFCPLFPGQAYGADS